MTRKSGVLLHFSSLATKFGTGDLGPEADKFIKFLSASGFSMWQVLPVNPVSEAFGYSPYSSYSAFAGNEILISPEQLADDGLISREDLASSYITGSKTLYRAASVIKEKLFRKAYKNFITNENGLFTCKQTAMRSFIKEEKSWLIPYAAFLLLKKMNSGSVWNEWGACSAPENHGVKEFLSSEEAMAEAEYIYFKQYLFYSQLSDLKNKANSKGISLIGDVPMFVCHDSADVWSHQELFDLDEKGRSRSSAGVPPDYFSKEGQLWGNPLYNWDKMAEDNYSWWVKRITHQLKYFDIIRIDHFRGLSSAWAVPASSQSARDGHWVHAHGYEMLTALTQELKAEGRLKIIAEDLGLITEDVIALRRDFGLPGMKILHFAFGSDSNNSYLPHNIEKNSVLYTGTHDNNTTEGWWHCDASDTEKKNFAMYCGMDSKSENVSLRMNSLALTSPADTVILTIQDILSLGEEARMNIPGTTKENWRWSLSEEDRYRLFYDPAISTGLRKMNEICGRAPQKTEA